MRARELPALPPRPPFTRCELANEGAGGRGRARAAGKSIFHSLGRAGLPGSFPSPDDVCGSVHLRGKSYASLSFVSLPPLVSRESGSDCHCATAAIIGKAGALLDPKCGGLPPPSRPSVDKS